MRRLWLGSGRGGLGRIPALAKAAEAAAVSSLPSRCSLTRGFDLPRLELWESIVI